MKNKKYELTFYSERLAHEYRNLIYKKGFECFTLRLTFGNGVGLYKVFIVQ